MKLAAWLQDKAAGERVKSAVVMSQDSDTLMQGMLIQHVDVTVLHTTLTDKGTGRGEAGSSLQVVTTPPPPSLPLPSPLRRFL